jgi:hypothetical protein
MMRVMNDSENKASEDPVDRSMTNKRLLDGKLFTAWELATTARDRESMIEILMLAGFCRTNAERTTDAFLVDPNF